MTPEMDALKVQILPEHQSLPYTVTKPKSKPTKSLILLIVASVTVTLGLLYVFNSNSVLSSGSLLRRRCTLRYSVLIDAGSSGTRVHVFGYWFESGKPVFDFGEKHYANLKLTPGLSAYADNPEGASVSVTKLVEFAKQRIPKRMLWKSDIRLMATAGMRLLEVPVQEKILDVTRRVLRSSEFMFRDEWATVISGSDEGIYAWIIANYALGSLGTDPLETTGIVELGGASAQVTFVSSEHVPPEFSRTISYGNVSYTIYSHSFLNYGKDAAVKRLMETLQNSANSTVDGIAEDPCTPKGYIYDINSKKYSSGFLADESKLKGSLQAAGNFSKCRSATFALLQEGKENCQYEHCSIGSTFTPDLQGSFLATSNFYYTAKFFELEEKGWLSELIPAGKRYCGEEWSKLILEYPTTDEEYLRGYCFSSAYIISMLHDSLGIALDDERITYANKAGEKHIPLDWALGAFILDAVTPTSDYSVRKTRFRFRRRTLR
ncbi:Nucleoside phosphatase GDA1/CD39 [Arabidopsis suecica]|uniref:apyrase n=1 Tax=Arabidopsis suecica TaxID=45249 RepID=A0A8T2H613_ARASU|nr:Nucleoside phosphatase GDA1/CD39 [Arabidopsis suecica]